jgi:hypothetical protein
MERLKTAAHEIMMMIIIIIINGIEMLKRFWKFVSEPSSQSCDYFQVLPLVLQHTNQSWKKRPYLLLIGKTSPIRGLTVSFDFVAAESFRIVPGVLLRASLVICLLFRHDLQFVGDCRRRSTYGLFIFVTIISASPLLSL